MKLHRQLDNDCFLLAELPLSWLLLLNDSHYPWFILVPRREGVKEVHQLSQDDRLLLLDESMYLSLCLEEVFLPDKLNIAALGNVVPQLHVHHIARFKSDTCWPAPVWGAVEATPYDKTQADEVILKIKDWFDNNTQLKIHWTAS